MTNEISIENRDDWNNGEHKITTADANEGDGDVKIGYPSQNQNANTDMPGYDDLLAQVRLDDSDNNDYSTENRSTTTHGPPSSTLGLLNFDVRSFSSGDIVEITDTTDLEQPSGDFSVAIWLKGDFNSIEEAEAFIFSCNSGGSGASDNISWGIQIDDDDGLYFTIGSASGHPDNDPPTDIGFNFFDGEWHFVVGVKDGDNVSIYVDGELQESGTQNPDYTSGKVVIGGHPDDGREDRSFPGDLSNAMFFTEALTESDIEKLYFNGHENNNFEGEYSSEIFEPENGDEVEWDNLELTISKGTSASGQVEVRALDSSNNEIDSTTITNLTDGTDTYDISDLDNSPKIQIISTHEVDIS